MGQMDDVRFEELFRQYQAVVFAWIVRIVRDRAAAEDLVIDTFWRVYRARNRFDERREFAPWVRRIATNCALNYLRTVRPQQLIQDVPTEPKESYGLEIAKAFESLSPKLRVVANLALVEQLPYEEIANALDISVGAVKSRVFRATRLLRSKLERMGITPC